MIKAEEYKTFLPDDLYAQIEEICKLVAEMQNEATGIVQEGKVPDSSAQLVDVLQHTEEATNDILDAATAIQELTQDQAITDLVMRIFEACNFQDISGQRIKKVLRNLDLLETKITRLAGTAKAYSPLAIKAEIISDQPTLNGPQRIQEAPSQDDIDKLFASF